ncbi:unnamed protein product [Camellia sinensis]
MGRALELLKTLKKVKGQARVQALKELRQIVSAHDSAKKTLAENNGFCLISSLLGCFTTHAVGSEAIGILVNFDLDSESITNLMQPAKMEPNLRPPTSDLLQYQETYLVLRASVMENSGKMMATPEMELRNSKYPVIRTTYTRLEDVHNSVRYSTIYPEKFPGSVPHWGSGNCDDDMCQIDDEDDLVIGASAKFDSALLSDDFNKSFNAMKGSLEPAVAALFHIGTTKSHPPIHEHLSAVAIDFFVKMFAEETKLKVCCIGSATELGSSNCDDDMYQIDDEDDLVIRAYAKFDFALLSDDFNKCWMREPNLRPAASDLLRVHPLVTREYQDAYPVLRASVMDVHNSVRCSTIYPEKFPRSVPHWESENCDDDLCQIDDEDDFLIGASAKFYSALLSDDFNKVLDVRLLRWLQESLLGASSIRRYVPALFHIGITKSHTFIPKQLSAEVIDILLKCLQKEPNLRHAAPDLLWHPFVTREHQETNPVLCTSVMNSTTYTQLKDAHNSVRCSTIYPEKFPRSVPHWGFDNCDDDMCQIDDEDDFLIGASTKFYSALLSDDFNKPADIWSVGCTVIEMATGKPSLSQQYQEQGTKLKACCIRSIAVIMIILKNNMATLEMELKNSMDPVIRTTYTRLKDIHNSVRCLTIYPEKFPRSVPHWGSDKCDDDMCQIDDEDDFFVGASTKFYSALLSDDFNKCWMYGYLDGYKKAFFEPAVSGVPPHLDIGTNKSHPSIPEHLSAEAVDILLKCLQKEYQENYPVLRASVMNSTTCARLKDVHNSVMCSTIYPEKFPGSVPQYGSYNCDDDMCEIDDEDVFVIGAWAKFYSSLLFDDFNKPTDIWSVGCTIIEMVSALFHVGTTKSCPSIPEHLSAEAIDIFLKYLQKEPNLRPAASDLLLDMDPVIKTTCMRLKDVHNNVRCLTIYPEKFLGSVPQWGSDNCDDDMCQIDDEDDFVIGASAKFDSALLFDNFNKMVTRKPSWSQQYQEVLARCHLGTTKSTPSVPEHLTAEAIDILLKFMQKGTKLKEKNMATSEMELKKSTTGMRLKDVHNSVRCRTIYPDKFPISVPHWGSDNCDDGMCRIDDEDDFVIGALAKFDSALLSDNFNKPTDIWTVGCMVIEMVTGKPSWSQQYHEVPALFHIGTAKCTPSVPEHPSAEAIDILEPNLRPVALDLLLYQEKYAVLRASVKEKNMATPVMELKNSTTCTRLKDAHNNVRCLTIYPEKFPGSVPQ